MQQAKRVAKDREQARLEAARAPLKRAQDKRKYRELGKEESRKRQKASGIGGRIGKKKGGGGADDLS